LINPCKCNSYRLKKTIIFVQSNVFHRRIKMGKVRAVWEGTEVIISYINMIISWQLLKKKNVKLWMEIIIFQFQVERKNSLQTHKQQQCVVGKELQLLQCNCQWKSQQRLLLVLRRTKTSSKRNQRILCILERCQNRKLLNKFINLLLN
jgi:hypothetical protein